jgi:hypothetical protein
VFDLPLESSEPPPVYRDATTAHVASDELIGVPFTLALSTQGVGAPSAHHELVAPAGDGMAIIAAMTTTKRLATMAIRFIRTPQ